MLFNLAILGNLLNRRSERCCGFMLFLAAVAHAEKPRVTAIFLHKQALFLQKAGFRRFWWLIAISSAKSWLIAISSAKTCALPLS
jgi:hypothetical protein